MTEHVGKAAGCAPAAPETWGKWYAMFWYGHDGVWGWFAMSLSMLVFWAVIIGFGVLLFRALGRSAEHPHTHTPVGPSPEQLLAERFARGEIDEEEYQRRLTALRASRNMDDASGTTRTLGRRDRDRPGESP